MGGIPEFSVFFQAADLQNWRQFKLGTGGKPIYELSSCFADRYEVLTSVNADNRLELDRWYKVRIEVRDERCTCKIRGQGVESRDDTRLRASNCIGRRTILPHAVSQHQDRNLADGTRYFGKACPKMPGDHGRQLAQKRVPTRP